MSGSKKDLERHFSVTTIKNDPEKPGKVLQTTKTYKCKNSNCQLTTIVTEIPSRGKKKVISETVVDDIPQSEVESIMKSNPLGTLFNLQKSDPFDLQRQLEKQFKELEDIMKENRQDSTIGHHQRGHFGDNDQENEEEEAVNQFLLGMDDDNNTEIERDGYSTASDREERFTEFMKEFDKDVFDERDN